MVCADCGNPIKSREIVICDVCKDPLCRRCAYMHYCDVDWARAMEEFGDEEEEDYD